MSAIPTVPFKVPLQGKPIDATGNWTPTWAYFFQTYLLNRVGGNDAPSNAALAAAIQQSVIGPASAVDTDVVIFDGTTGRKVKDSGVLIGSLAPKASPTFTGIPAAPTAVPGTATTQIATTAFVGAATANDVQGPASSADSNIALFNGTTGKAIKDSGVLLSSLAPKASPTFTGTPAAPTAIAGTNNTQLATTAFVTTAVAAAGLTASSFSAHNNGVAQSIPNATFTKLTFSTTPFNVGSNLASSTWTPPAGRLVTISGAMGMTSGANTLITLAVYKNGAEYKRGTMMNATIAGTVVVNVSCIDTPNGTDTYELWGYQAAGAAANTNGAANLTYFQGTTVQA